jgi:hypothetical protein
MSVKPLLRYALLIASLFFGAFSHAESPRVCRRLIFLGELANEQTTWIFT